MTETQLPQALIAEYRSVRERDGDTAPPVVLMDFDEARDEALRCPNCGGVRGKGKFYAPTGADCAPYHMGGSATTRGINRPLRRSMKSYICPACSGSTHRSILQGRCGVPDPIRVARAEVWTVKGREGMVTEVNRALAQWTREGPAGWLSLIGPYGCGKSFLAQRAVARLVEADIEAVYAQAHQVGRRIMDAVTSSLPADSAVDRFRRVPVLAIDQLDWLRQYAASGQMTFVLETLLNLLDERYMNRHQQATILVLNRDWWISGGGELAPIVSRATEGWIAETDVPNLREIAGQIERGEVLV